ncbi:MAG: DUF4115 domain-containing protein [Thermodesulfobacteriota bacterium]|nr:DUF4115 domain-containing protein [Thermodesulfobacteriota bacterium]
MTTSSDHSGLSFGRYLQACRLERGMSLEMLANETRISMDTLAAIENEDYSRLPKEVYARGFLRSCARAVGADGDRVIRSYEENLAISNRIILAEQELERENARFWRKVMFSTMTLLAVIVLTIFLAQPRVPSSGITEPSSPETSAPQQKESQLSPVSEPALSPQKRANTANPSESDKILLEIRTIEKTWVKIVVDNQKPKEYTLKPGDHLALEANSGFNILIGNATGVQLLKNGQPVFVPGKQGQVVNMEIP